MITRLNVGGPATHVVLADRGLGQRGWETLLAFGSVEPDELEIDVATVGVPSVRIPALARPIRPADDLRAAAAITKLIRSYRPDVIHTHLSKAGLIGRTVAIATSRAIRVHTFHGTIFGGYFGASASRAIVLAERMLGARTHALIALSERQRAELLEHRVARGGVIEIVPLGLELGRFSPAGSEGARAAARRQLEISPEAFVVVAVGRLVAIKRLDRLVDAFALVVNQLPTARLYLVGDGAARHELERKVDASGLSDRVAFRGWSRDVVDWYAAADVVALTSEREGTPLALIEAAAAARPVVATDVGGVADVVVDGVTGFVVAPGDATAFAEAVLRLANDGELASAMSRQTPARALGFAAERLADDLDSLYRRRLGVATGVS